MKKILLSLLFLILPSLSHAATLYGCTSGGTFSGSIWTATTLDQAACSSGVGPGTTNDLVQNAASGNVTIAGAAAANSLDQTGYTGTLAFGTQTLTLAAASKIGGAMTNSSGTISTAGNITLLSTATGSSPKITITAAITLTSGGFTWPGNLTFNVAGNVILVGNWINTGLITFSAATNVNVTTAETITANGGLISTSATGATPTATIILGGGTWSGSSALRVNNNITFAGNSTISGNVAWGLTGGGGTLTYSSGTITTTGSTITIAVNSTLNLNGMSLNNFTASGNITLTLGSNLSVLGNFNNNGSGTFSNIIFLGAFNISIGTLNFSPSTANCSLNIPAGQTLTVTTAMKFIGNPFFAMTLLSGTGSSSAFLNYTGPISSQNISLATFTDIDASGSSRVLYNWYGGTLTRTSNITNVTAANIGSGGLWIQ